jgi:hypothetical protein
MNGETYNSQPIGKRKLWFGLAAAGSAFFTEVVTIFVVSWAACYAGHGELGAWPQSSVRWVLAGITIVLFTLSVTGGVMSYQHWRQLSGSNNLAHSEAEPNDEFVSMVGALCSAAMSLGILWISLPLIIINICIRSL